MVSTRIYRNQLEELLQQCETHMVDRMMSLVGLFPVAKHLSAHAWSTGMPTRMWLVSGLVDCCMMDKSKAHGVTVYQPLRDMIWSWGGGGKCVLYCGLYSDHLVLYIGSTVIWQSSAIIWRAESQNGLTLKSSIYTYPLKCFMGYWWFKIKFGPQAHVKCIVLLYFYAFQTISSTLTWFWVRSQ